jgi:hypothetical protein
LLNSEKLAKEINANKAINNDEKNRYIELKNSIENGILQNVIKKYEKKINDLFQNYWVWDK